MVNSRIRRRMRSSISVSSCRLTNGSTSVSLVRIQKFTVDSSQFTGFTVTTVDRVHSHDSSQGLQSRQFTGFTVTTVHRVYSHDSSQGLQSRQFTGFTVTTVHRVCSHGSSQGLQSRQSQSLERSQLSTC